MTVISDPISHAVQCCETALQTLSRAQRYEAAGQLLSVITRTLPRRLRMRAIEGIANRAKNTALFQFIVEETKNDPTHH